jgi:hypothetical protein
VGQMCQKLIDSMIVSKYSFVYMDCGICLMIDGGWLEWLFIYKGSLSGFL